MADLDDELEALERELAEYDIDSDDLENIDVDEDDNLEEEEEVKPSSSSSANINHEEINNTISQLVGNLSGPNLIAALKAKLEEVSQNNNALIDEVDDIKQQHEAFKEQSKHSKDSRIVQLSDKLDLLNDQIFEEEEENINLDQILRRTQREFEQLKEKNSFLLKEQESIKSQHEKRVEQLEASIQSATTQLETNREELLKIVTKAQSDLTAAKEENQTLKTQNVEKILLVEQLEVDLENAKQSRSQSELHTEQTKSTLDQRVKAINDQVTETNAKNDAFVKDTQKKKDEIDAIYSKQRAQQRVLNKVKLDRDEASRGIEKFNREITRQKTQIERLETEIEELEQEKREILRKAK